MPYPCSHFYFDIKFGDRLYSKEERRAWPLLFWIKSVAKFDVKVKVTTWIGHQIRNSRLVKPSDELVICSCLVEEKKILFELNASMSILDSI